MGKHKEPLLAPKGRKPEASFIGHLPCFLIKREITVEVATFKDFKGSLLSRGRYFRDLLTTLIEILSLLSESRYFRGSLLSELCGIYLRFV